MLGSKLCIGLKMPPYTEKHLPTTCLYKLNHHGTDKLNHRGLVLLLCL
jgi:hypothetical protein